MVTKKARTWRAFFKINSRQSRGAIIRGNGAGKRSLHGAAVGDDGLSAGLCVLRSSDTRRWCFGVSCAAIHIHNATGRDKPRCIIGSQYSDFRSRQNIIVYESCFISVLTCHWPIRKIRTCKERNWGLSRIYLSRIYCGVPRANKCQIL